MSKQITIRMPKEDLALWLAALRLPENQDKQGQGALFRTSWLEGVSSPGYCCLGVAQQVCYGGVEATELNSDGSLRLANGYPSSSFLEEHQWTFLDRRGDRTTNPYLPKFKCTAGIANDGFKKTFAEIADAIEDCAEGF